MVVLVHLKAVDTPVYTKGLADGDACFVADTRLDGWVVDVDDVALLLVNVLFDVFDCRLVRLVVAKLRSESLPVLLAGACWHGLLPWLFDLNRKSIPLLCRLLIQVTLDVRIPPARAGTLVRPVSIIERLEVEAALRLIQPRKVTKRREVLLLV